MVTDADLDLLQSRVLPEGRKPPADHLILTAKKDEAQRLNRYRFDNLPGTAHVYTAVASGHFAKALDEEELPAPRELDSRLAPVSCSLSTIPATDGVMAPWQRLSDSKTTESSFKTKRANSASSPMFWKKVRFTLRSGQLSEETTDEYRQYPFVLGWAITIHRAQGRTLEKVFVDLSQGAFAAGQAYVAISRVTRLEGLLLRTRPRARDFFVHERVSVFLDYIGDRAVKGCPD